MEAQPDQVSTLHRRASEWYEQNGLPSDAIRHALAAEDFEAGGGPDRAGMAGSEDGSSQSATWLGWVKSAAGRADPRPACAQCLVCLRIIG